MDLEPSGEQPPKLRASDADRERTVARLRRHHADGRLDLEEFNQRIDQAYAAKTVDELDHVMRDLPPEVPPAWAPPSPAARLSQSQRKRGFYRVLASYGGVMVLLVVIWAVTGAGYFWPVWPMIGWGFAIVWQGIGTFLGDDDNKDRRR